MNNDSPVSNDTSAPEGDVEAFRRRFTEVARQDAKQQASLRRANIAVLVAGVATITFFVAATISVGHQVRQLREQKDKLVVEKRLLLRETDTLQRKAEELRSQVGQLEQQRDELRRWSEEFYGKLEVAAESDRHAAADVLRSTPPPPTGNPAADARKLWREGQVAAGAEDLARAEALYLQAIAQNPGYARALNSMGLLRQKQGRTAEALEFYKRAVQAEPTYAAAVGNLSTLLLQSNNVPEAIFWCSRALALDEPPRLIHEVQDRLQKLGIECTERDAAERYFRAGENAYAAGAPAAGLASIGRGCELGEELACRFLARHCKRGLKEACDLMNE